MTSKRKPTYFCPDCGSTEIHLDTQVKWDPETSAWVVLEAVLFNPWCQDCGEDLKSMRHLGFGRPPKCQSGRAGGQAGAA